MKWIVPLSALILASGCSSTYTHNDAILPYQQVNVAPIQKTVAYTTTATRVVIVKPILVDYVAPADMMTSVGFDYY